jgi:hypothetical protein
VALDLLDLPADGEQRPAGFENISRRRRQELPLAQAAVGEQVDPQRPPGLAPRGHMGNAFSEGAHLLSTGHLAGLDQQWLVPPRGPGRPPGGPRIRAEGHRDAVQPGLVGPEEAVLDAHGDHR